MSTPQPAAPDERRIAVALLRRIESVLGLSHLPADVVSEPMQRDGATVIGPHVLDSLDVIEALVAVQQDIGVSLLDRVDLAEAGSLLGLARLASAKADPAALHRFCAAWSTYGDYLP